MTNFEELIKELENRIEEEKLKLIRLEAGLDLAKKMAEKYNVTLELKANDPNRI